MKLEQIPEPSRPKEKLEQYPTPSWIVADILWDLKLRGYTKKYGLVFDLGSGTGRICIGSIITGFKECIGIEIDETLIRKMQETTLYGEHSEAINVVRGDVRNLPFRKIDNSLVVMNPPFGVKRKGIDLVFLENASKLSEKIFSIHLDNEKSILYLRKKMEEKGYRLSKINNYNMELKQKLSHHKARIKRIRVALLEFTR